MVAPAALHLFRDRDPVARKWTRARYRASLVEIAKRYVECELIGQPEYRTAADRMFNLFAGLVDGAALDISPQLDEIEVFLAACFLRRYVTYCARRRQLDQMLWAAALLREIGMRQCQASGTMRNSVAT